MASRAGCVRKISKVFSRSLCSVNPYKESKLVRPISPKVFFSPVSVKASGICDRGWVQHVRWFGTSSAGPEILEADLLEFLESTVDRIEGPYHYWLNSMGDTKKLFVKDGIFLILVNAFLQDPLMSAFDHIGMVERLKWLQQRFPELQVFGLQYDSHILNSTIQNQILKMITNEYITFPVLLSARKFMQMKDGALYLLFKGFKEPALYFTKDVELANICKEISQLNTLPKESSSVLGNLKSPWVKCAEIIKEPSVYPYLKNLLLDFAGCVSVDEHGSRIFVSDTNHHRIIIIDGNGHILDSIGSSPGFEDGGFEIAKIMRPASSVYNATEDCLYFVDSENHAIRCASFQKRVVHTVYPPPESNKTSNLWRWLLDKLKMMRQASESTDEYEMDMPCFPWHILKSEERSLFITNRSFDSLWIVCTATGKVEKSCKGLEAVMDLCKPIVRSRLAMAKEVYGKLQLQHKTNLNSPKELAYADLISSVVKFQEDILFCDTDGGKIIRYHQESDSFSSVQLSNFGVLGLPYWLDCPVEKVFSGCGHRAYVPANDCLLQHFNVHPGKCNIKIHVDVPDGAQLAAPLQDGCFWCQARGSAAEVLRSEAADAAKVGVAQQWYDELDDLAFTSADTASEINSEEQADLVYPQGDASAHIDCCVTTSPGTSEIVVCAVFYLKLRDMHNNGVINDVSKAKQILGISNHGEDANEGESSISLLLESQRDLSNEVFMRPLHLRIRLDCHDDSTDKCFEIIPIDSTIKVNVSLN